MGCLDKNLVISHPDLLPGFKNKWDFKVYPDGNDNIGARPKKLAREAAADILLTAFYPDEHVLLPANEKFSESAEKTYRTEEYNQQRMEFFAAKQTALEIKIIEINKDTSLDEKTKKRRIEIAKELHKPADQPKYSDLCSAYKEQSKYVTLLDQCCSKNRLVHVTNIEKYQDWTETWVSANNKNADPIEREDEKRSKIPFRANLQLFMAKDAESQTNCLINVSLEDNESGCRKHVKNTIAEMAIEEIQKQGIVKEILPDVTKPTKTYNNKTGLNQYSSFSQDNANFNFGKPNFATGLRHSGDVATGVVRNSNFNRKRGNNIDEHAERGVVILDGPRKPWMNNAKMSKPDYSPENPYLNDCYNNTNFYDGRTNNMVQELMAQNREMMQRMERNTAMVQQMTYGGGANTSFNSDKYSQMVGGGSNSFGGMGNRMDGMLGGGMSNRFQTGNKRGRGGKNKSNRPKMNAADWASADSGDTTNKTGGWDSFDNSEFNMNNWND